MGIRSRQLVHLATFFLLIGLPALVSAQVTAVTDETQPPIPGAGHDYLHEFSETVNPANGSVSLRLAVPLPGGRLLNPPFSFDYDSAGVYETTSFGAPGYAEYQPSPAAYFNQGGWSYSFPLISYVQARVPNLTNQNEPCFGGMDYVFSSPSGGRHPLLIATQISNPTGTECTWPFSGTSVSPGGDSQIRAVVANNGAGPVWVHDASGTMYEFQKTSICGGGSGQSAQVAQEIEDRNGNLITYSTDTNCTGAVTMTDTAGRPAVVTSGFGHTGNTVTVSGLTNPYTITWGSASASFNVPHTPTPAFPSGVLCTLYPTTSSQTAITQITLPNSQSYTFSYDTNYGLLNKITYPNGAYVSYTWGIGSSISPAEYGQWKAGQSVYGEGDQPANGICGIVYNIPAIQSRTVSFDGTHIAETQTFAYCTYWTGSTTCNMPNGSTTWSSKTTTVTTTVYAWTGTANVLVNTYTTKYTYQSVPAPQQPQFNYPNYSFAAQIPVESAVEYDADTSGTILETVAEVWEDPYLQRSKQITWANGLTSKVCNTYTAAPSSLQELTQKEEYDYGATSPTRTTVIGYQWSFANGPFLPYSPISDRECSVAIYNGTVSAGNLAAETEYFYDGGATSAVCGTPGTTAASSVSGLPSGTHDETDYGPSVSPPRGNVTAVVRQCWSGSGSGCTSPSGSYGSTTTSYAYDETGQPTSMTDPNNNITQYSFADQPPGANSYGNSNAYLTQITWPTTNGIRHIEAFQYGYGYGELTRSTDENGNSTTYSYDDPFARLTAVAYPDGGQKSIAYEDVAKQVITSTAINSGTTMTSTKQMDGMWHVIQTQRSDPDGTDYTDSVYDGEANIYSVSDAYRTKSDPTYGVTSYTYDPLRRMTLKTNPDRSTEKWSYGGTSSTYTTTFTDENGNQWQRTTDSFGRLTGVVEPSGSSPTPSMITTYGYDALNDLISVTQRGDGSLPARSRSFQYDSLARLISSSNPETGQTTYEYDPYSNLRYKVDARGIATTITYDALNRVTSKAYSNDPSGTPTSCYAYDQLSGDGTNLVGNLTQEWTQTGTCPTSGGATSYLTLRQISAYDPMNRAWNDQQCTPSGCQNATPCQASGGGGKQSYTYDLAGNLTCWTNGLNSTPGASSAVALSTTYDSANRLATVGSTWSDSKHPASLFTAQPSSSSASCGQWTSRYAPFGGLANAVYGGNSSFTISRGYNNRLGQVCEMDDGMIPQN